jgi:peptidoglycan/xylan/chitin deacetylase (PgdA/CDA1 family)
VAVSSRRDLGFTKKPVHVRLQRRCNGLVAAMVAVSSAVRNAVVSTEGFPASRIRVIPNGVDTQIFTPRGHVARARLGLADGDLVVGTLANFNPVKGYDVLAPAIQTIAARHPTVRFLLVGDGPLFEVTKARLAALGPRVLFPGAQRRVAEVLSAMDLFVLASHSEGFSNAILQAMACGLPVLCTDVGGNREACEEGGGVLVPPGDPDALAQAMLALLEDEPRRRSLGGAALDRARTTFAFRHMVCDYENYLEMAAAEPGTGGARRRAIKRVLGLGYAAVRPVVRRPPRGRALVLCYHRVVPELRGYDPALLVGPETLRWQMEALGRRYRFVPLADLVSELERGGPGQQLAAVTFDDGYEDNLLHGLPILQALGVPFTVFVTVGATEEGRPAWFDRVAACILSSDQDRVRLALRARPELRGLDALGDGGPPAPGILAREILGALESLPDAERRVAAEAIEGELVPDPAFLPRHLSWPQVAELARAGVEIGSHSLSHPILTRVSDAVLDEELVASRRALQQRTSLPILGLAYPVGVHDERVQRAAERAGYRYALSLDSPIWGGNRFRIGRVAVSDQTSRGYAAPFSADVFLADVEGFLDWFRSH